MADKKITLYDREGNKYETSDKVEATRLKVAYGYTDSPKKPAKSSDKS